MVNGRPHESEVMLLGFDSILDTVFLTSWSVMWQQRTICCMRISPYITSESVSTFSILYHPITHLFPFYGLSLFLLLR